jgi:hypothetical protein
MIKALLDRDYPHREIVETGHGSSRVKTAPTPAAVAREGTARHARVPTMLPG